ncbi:hypothetical protein [Actinosynnema sp. NPDC023587]|uniref:hypothetical protein n=1 Tax=Actinosynnema sp. NPDC023587 TaxID=3154695 RepID=UPI0033CF409C
MLLFFGSSGDLHHLYQPMNEHGLHNEVVTARHITRDDVPVDYVTFRVIGWDVG